MEEAHGDACGTMSHHQFDTDHAVKYGINAAVILHNLIFWIEKNKANKKHLYEGRTWTYNSVKAWSELFPYLTKKQVRTALDLLRDKGVIMTGNFNEKTNDNTLWYAFADEGKWLALQGKESAPEGKAVALQGNPIIVTDSKPYIKPDVNTPLPPSGETGNENPGDLKKEENTKSIPDGGGATLEVRTVKFAQEVWAEGGAIYTSEMIKRFISYWTEPDRGRRQKMRFEKEKAFFTTRRLNTWATNNLDKIECYLTPDQKSIEQKRRDFAKTLEPYKGRYDGIVLNEFYRHWSQPENVPQPKKLRWETEQFWDLATRLAAWKTREQQKPSFNNQSWNNNNR
jgi:hypothetical protein